MRNKIFFNVRVVKAQLKSASKVNDAKLKGISQKFPIFSSETATAANIKGLMNNWAVLVTKTALERKFMECLLERKVGTCEMEVQAIKISNRMGMSS